jgi:imidazolonepropionase-like amidohydrolase
MTGSTVFRHVQIFDGQGVIPADSVLVTDGVIAGVGHDLDAPDGAAVIDGTSTHTLLPGLIDAHTHVVGPALERALVFGVTTELDMANLADQMRAAKARDAEPEAGRQADLRSAGAAATVPGGHGTQVVPDIPTLTEPDEAEAFVAARVAEGSDYIKIHYKDGQRAAQLAGHDMPVISLETMEAVAAGASRHGLLSLAHIGTQDAAIEAIKAGVRGLAHIFVDREPEPDFGPLLARQSFVIPTLVMAERLGGGELPSLAEDPRLVPYLDDADLTLLRRVAGGLEPGVPVDLRAALAAVAAAAQAGAPVLAGTDSVVALHGAALHRELALLVGAGLTPLQALRSATGTTADVFGLADRGRIARGLRGDLVLVEGDPTADILATHAIAGVWKRGVAVPRTAAALASPG